MQMYNVLDLHFLWLLHLKIPGNNLCWWTLSISGQHEKLFLELTPFPQFGTSAPISIAHEHTKSLHLMLHIHSFRYFWRLDSLITNWIRDEVVSLSVYCLVRAFRLSHKISVSAAYLTAFIFTPFTLWYGVLVSVADLYLIGRQILLVTINLSDSPLRAFTHSLTLSHSLSPSLFPFLLYINYSVFVWLNVFNTTTGPFFQKGHFHFRCAMSTYLSY